MAILYQSSRFYHALMTLVYRTHRRERFQAVSRWVPEDAEVLDVCCGDGSLAEHLLPSARYRGLDQSAAFVREGQRRGHRVEQFDVMRDKLPSAQIIVCQVSLFQFYPAVDTVLSRLYEAAEQRLIISESVLSLTQSRWSWIASIVAWGTDPNGMSNNRFRFNEETLKELFSPYREHILDAREVCGGRDWVYVLEK